MDLLTLVARLTLDRTQYDKGLDGAQSKARSISSKLIGGLNTVSKVTTDALAVVGKATIKASEYAINAVKDLTEQSVMAYAEQEQLIGGVETLFKESAADVFEYADAAYKTAGMTANEYMTTVTGFSASLLQGLKGDTKAAAKIANTAITDMADNVNKMGTSMEMVQNTYAGLARQNYTMLDNLHIGYQGTASEMARLINDSKVMGENFVATADNIKDISFDKYIEAIHVVQEQMGITGTTALEASSTISGSIASARSAWQNFVADISNGNVDLGKSFDEVINSVTGAAENIIPRVLTALNSLDGSLRYIIPQIFETLSKGIDTYAEDIILGITNTFGGIVYYLNQYLPEAISKLGDLISDLLYWFVQSDTGELGDMVGGVISGIIQQIPKIIPGLLDVITIELYTLFRRLAEDMPRIMSSLLETVISTIDYFFNEQWGTEFLDLVIDFIMSIVDGIAEAIPVILKNLPKIITNIFSQIIKHLPKIIRGAIKLLSAVIKGLIAAIPELIKALPQIILDIAVAIAESIPELLKAIVDMVSDIGQALYDAAPEALQGFIDSVGEAFGKAFELIKTIWYEIGPFFSDLWENVKEIFTSVTNHIQEQFENAKEIVESIWNAVVEFYKEAFNSIVETYSAISEKFREYFEAGKEAVVKAWDSVVKFFSDIWDGIVGVFVGVGEWFSEKFSQASKNVSDAFNGVGKFFSDLWEDIKQVFRDVKEWFENVGSNIVEGIKTGISNAWTAFKGWVSEKFNSLISLGESIFGIASPSKVFRDKIGAMLVKGITEGVESTMPRETERIRTAIDITKNVSAQAKTAGIALANSIREGFTNSVSQLLKVVVSLYTNIVDALKTALASMMQLFKTLLGNLTNIAQSFSSVGQAITSGIMRGINSGWTMLVDLVKQRAVSLLKAAKTVLGIHSPSTLFQDEVGAMLAKGIQVGFLDEMPRAIQSIQSELDGLSGLNIPALTGMNNINNAPAYASESGGEGGNEIVLMIDGHELARFLAPAMNSQLAFGRT